MKFVMRTVAHIEAKREVMRENDVVLVMTEVADSVVSEPTDEVKAIIESREPRAFFSEKHVVRGPVDSCTVTGHEGTGEAV